MSLTKSTPSNSNCLDTILRASRIPTEAAPMAKPSRISSPIIRASVAPMAPSVAASPIRAKVLASDIPSD